MGTRTPLETLKLSSGGREVFATHLLEQDHYYELTFSGLVSYGPYHFDPCYQTDDQGNLTKLLKPNDLDPHIVLFGVGPLHPNLLKDGADRATHTYRMTFRATNTVRFGARIQYADRPGTKGVWGYTHGYCVDASALTGGFEIQIIERPDLLEAELRREQENEKKVAEQAAREVRQEAERERLTKLQIAQARAREEEAKQTKALLQAEAARLRLQEERERRAHAVQVEREQSWQERQKVHEARFARLRETILLYKDFNHYQNPAWIEKHARAHLQELLQSREQIITTLRNFHNDQQFIDLLKQRSPETYERATWRIKALAKAEEFEVDLKDRRQKPTPEDWRERTIRRLKLKVDDQIAFQTARQRAFEDHKAFLDEWDLTEEQREEYINEFEDEIDKVFNPQPDRNGGGHETIS